MRPLDAAQPAAGARETGRSALALPFALGMGVNLASLVVGDPYRVAIMGLGLALVATLAWSGRPLAWIVFTAVLAANPANTTTPVALNLLCAAVYFPLARRTGFGRLPRLAQIALLLALLSLGLSILASLWADPVISTIHTTDVSQARPWLITWAGGVSLETLTSQGISVANYLLGPFLFIPLACSRIREEHDPDLLLKGLVLGLLVPTLLMFMAARAVGRPTFDANALREGLLNVSTFRLGQVDIQMIRTQVGIILGTGLGALLGLVLVGVLRRYPFVRLPGDVYFIDRVPVVAQAGDFLGVAAVAIAITILATLAPSHEAARLKPMEIIRWT